MSVLQRTREFPFTPGHETAGEVAQLGPNASGEKLGAVFGSWVAVVGQGRRLVVVELLVGKCQCRCRPCKR
ncbi:alcohol dehydrogenase catalytic domain-containing protein [Pseudooceanicola sp.]|uniref:alcohol dehydrogenase catalytic domain-containing protein n=1 Tax=Pseudooceanicola sp. TaxID=1914328 RepID=UPI0040599355